METCEICGRPKASSDRYESNDCIRWLGAAWWDAPGPMAECYRLGYEREKGRADALSAKLAELPSWIKAAYEREPYRGSISDFCTDLAHSLAERLNEPTT